MVQCIISSHGRVWACTASRGPRQVQYTKAKEVPGLPPLSDFVMDKEVPVNSVWKMLPWNGGRSPTCSVEVKYLDDEMRIVADRDGELFVYMRPGDPRGL